jgi:hypothetical protein
MLRCLPVPCEEIQELFTFSFGRLRRATFVKNRETFWVGVESPKVRVERSLAQDEPITEPSAAAGAGKADVPARAREQNEAPTVAPTNPKANASTRPTPKAAQAPPSKNSRIESVSPQ